MWNNYSSRNYHSKVISIYFVWNARFVSICIFFWYFYTQSIHNIFSSILVFVQLWFLIIFYFILTSVVSVILFSFFSLLNSHVNWINSEYHSWSFLFALYSSCLCFQFWNFIVWSRFICIWCAHIVCLNCSRLWLFISSLLFISFIHSSVTHEFSRNCCLLTTPDRFQKNKENILLWL